MAVQFCQQLFTAALLNIKRRRQLSRKDLVVVLLSFYFKYMKLEICGFKKIKKISTHLLKRLTKCDINIM